MSWVKVYGRFGRRRSVAWRHCEQMKVVVVVCVVWMRLGGRMLVVELGNVAAVRRREVCIDIVEAKVCESSRCS